MTSALETAPKTTFGGALAEPSAVLVSFPKPDALENLKTIPAGSKPAGTRKPRRGTGDGISRRASGKWEARARPLDPATGEPGPLKRLTFDTKQAAEEWQIAARAGVSRTLSVGEQIQAVRAYAALAEAGCTVEDLGTAVAALAKLRADGRPTSALAEAVAEYQTRHPTACGKTVAQWYTEWLDRKKAKNRKTRTIASARYFAKALVTAHGSARLDTITTAQLETLVSTAVIDDETNKPTEPSVRTRINRIVVFKDFFASAAKQGLLSPNHLPSTPLEKPQDDEDTLATPYTVPEFETLLNHAWSHEDTYACTAYVAIGGLAAVRNSELMKLRFGPDGIDVKNGRIIISAAIAKKRRARIIQMPTNLRQILIALRNRPKPTMRFKNQKPVGTLGSPAVMPYRLRTFKKFLAASGFIWKPNALRCSAASYYYESSGYDTAKTLALLGHVSNPDVWLTHYKALITPGLGAKYYALLPRGLPTRKNRGRKPSAHGVSAIAAGEVRPAPGGSNTPADGTSTTSAAG